MAAGFCALLASAPVAAQASLDTKFSEGFALEAFEPAPAGDRFFALPDAASATDGKLRLGLVGDYPTAPVLRRTDNVTGQTANVIGHQLYLHAGAAYPITDFLHANLDVPFVAAQGGDTKASPGAGVFGDPRIGVRANLVSPSVQAVAIGPAVDVWVPIGDAANLAGDGKPRVNARLGVSGRAGAFVYSANGGYLVRKKVDTQSLEYGDALTFGAAVGVSLFSDVLQVGPELWGNRQVSPHFSDSKVTALSSLFGAKVHIGDFVAGAAAGPGLTDAPGVAPRLVVSLALAPQTQVSVEAHILTDRDGDRVGDAQDACPDAAGVASTDPAKNGCPSAAATPPVMPEAAPEAAPVDGDGDGIPDAQDACPDKLGDRSDDPKTNGCPKARIADADGDGVRDEVDACPDVKGDPTSDPRTNGCPPKLADTDGDGVLDRTDACPRDAGEPSNDPKTNGCPSPVATTTAPAGGDPSGIAQITFSGFHVFQDGSSRLFVQLSQPTSIEAKVAGKKAEFLITGARVPIRNNKNPLLTRHFTALVVSARLVPEGATRGKGKAKAKSDVRLVVEMREAGKPDHRVVRNPDGSATLVIDFPKPVTPPSPEPDEAPPAQKASDAEPPR
jgi:hypothetical protein